MLPEPIRDISHSDPFWKQFYKIYKFVKKIYKLNFEQLNVYLTPHLFSWSVISEANLSELQYLQTNFRLEHRVF